MIEWKTIKFDSLPSTQHWAIENLTKLKEGDLVTALKQTEGIGRHGRHWQSPEGGLYLSLILEPKRRISDLVDLMVLSAEAVGDMLKTLGINLNAIDASALFLDRLAGVSDPEKKRKIIGNTFIDIFETEAERVGRVDFLAQGTLYPDVIEAVSFKGPSATIKSHHNVGGLKDRMKLKLVEPLRELFKDEVRVLGQKLGIPRQFIGRHPFPGPGLAVRILGDVTRERCDLLREVDAIFIEELLANDIYDDIWQAFVVLLPIKAVGVMGDERTYEHVVALRAVTSVDGMTADWAKIESDIMAHISNRIIREVAGINRVVYDISSKPPATIEWE